MDFIQLVTRNIYQETSFAFLVCYKLLPHKFQGQYNNKIKENTIEKREKENEYKRKREE